MNALFKQLQQSLPMSPQARLPQNLKSLPSLKNSLSQFQNILNGGSSPSSIVQNMILNNPQVKQIVEAFPKSGMTAKDFFYQNAKNFGVDPDQFLNS